MMKRFVFPVLLLLTGLVGFSAASGAETDETFYTRPKMTASGDWLTNAGPRQGKVASPAMAGALWRVVSAHLNCRKDLGLDAPIIRRFGRGTVLQADVGRGGADEVLINALDSRGKPWMRVRSRDGTDFGCYVRAHRSFIRPLP